MQMKTKGFPTHNIGLWLIVLGLMLANVKAGSASPETYRHGGSTAVIEQSGGSGRSESQVTRYRDGQKIITQDGASTDITIQHGGAVPPPGTAHAKPSISRFDRPGMQQRFRSGFLDFLDDLDDADAFREQPESVREAFRQQMLDRMREPFGP
jgi:hypothetical protein